MAIKVEAAVLQEARVPQRLWILPEDPFVAEPIPLQWWERRRELVAQRRGLVLADGLGSTVKLKSMTQLLKRLLGDPTRPMPDGYALRRVGLYIEARELQRGEELTRAAETVAFLLLVNIGIAFAPWTVERVQDLTAERWRNGLITFYHFVPNSKVQDVLVELADHIDADSIWNPEM